MKIRAATAIALSLAFAQMAAPAAYAQQTMSEFRTAAPQAFTTDDLQRYGLSADDAAQVAAYQEQGYQVQVLTPEEAEQYNAGLTNNQWFIVGLVVLVVVVAAVV